MEKQRSDALRILLVESNVMYREGLAELLAAQSDFTLVRQVGSMRDAVTQAHLLRPDVVLLDTCLPDSSADRTVRLILAEQPSCRIILLAAHDDDESLFSGIRMGARGYLLKNLPAANLVAALRAILEGELILFGSVMTRHSAVDVPASSRRDCPLDQLTRSELQVLRELSMGATNNEVARRLYVPESSVRKHIDRILEKLNLPDQRSAARVARQNGLRVG